MLVSRRTRNTCECAFSIVLDSASMRSRLLLTSFLLLLLAGAALAGWAWGSHEHRLAGDAAFLQRRLGLLEADNQRLAHALEERQRAAVAATDHARRTEIERTVARLRELEFLRPVIYREIPRADLPAILRQKLAQQVPDQEFGNAAISLAALGLLPAGLDLKKTYLALLGEQIGAFYDQHSAELFTFSGQPLDNGQNRVILAHELTHALEDQHFQLARLPLEAKGNDDRALAASALVEGDATLVMSRYMIGDMSPTVLKDTLTGAFTTDLRQMAAAPRYLRETLLFPYLRGQEFCQTLYQTGGWDALAAAFRHPPDSTAQILHPERFLARRTEPAATVDFPVTMILGHEPVGNNVLGEFGVRQWFAKWLKEEGEADRVAAGWAADRYLVFGNAANSSYVWKSVWASPEAANRFAAAAARCWQERYHLIDVVYPVDAATGEWTVSLPNGRQLVLMRHDTQVALIDAQDDRWKNAFRELLGATLTANSSNDARPR